MRVTIRNVDKDTWARFNRAVLDIYGTSYGHIGEVLTSIIDQWLDAPQQHHQSTISAKSQAEKNDHRADVQENIERLRSYLRTDAVTERDDHTNRRELVKNVYNCLKGHKPNLDMRTAESYAERLIRLGYVQSNPLSPISLFYNRDWLKITDEDLSPSHTQISTIEPGTAGQGPSQLHDVDLKNPQTPEPETTSADQAAQIPPSLPKRNPEEQRRWIILNILQSQRGGCSKEYLTQQFIKNRPENSEQYDRIALQETLDKMQEEELIKHNNQRVELVRAIEDTSNILPENVRIASEKIREKEERPLYDNRKGSPSPFKAVP